MQSLQTDHNARRNRQHAFWLAILLHGALASGLYVVHLDQRHAVSLDQPPVVRKPAPRKAVHTSPIQEKPELQSTDVLPVSKPIPLP
jgi:hypothetical protein